MLEWIVSSCLLILVVLGVRAALGERISAGLRYALWAVVLFRLLVPVQLFTSPLTGIEVAPPPEALREKSIYLLPVDSKPVGESSVSFTEDGMVRMDPNSFGYPRLTEDGERVVRYAEKISPLDLAKWLWLAGTAVLGVVFLVSNVSFAAKLRRVRKPLQGVGAPIPVYLTEGLPSPCLFGLFRTAVYVTPNAAADQDMLRHILVHELTHYRHLDHFWSALRSLALALHWWNPLVWLAAVYSRRDAELACDAGALRRLGNSQRTAYGETLLTLVTAKAGPRDLLYCATTMTGEKRSLQKRISRIACQPKPLASALAAVVIVLSLSVLVAFGHAEEMETTDVPDRQEAPDTPSVPDGAWQSAEITLDENGVPHIRYTYPDGLTDLNGEPIPAPREWADQDLAGRNKAAALEGSPDVWAKLVSARDGWLVACYGRGVAAADTYVYKTEDSGMNWTEVTMPGTGWHIADVGFLSPERLIVAQRLFDGAPCFLTKDGGETWEEIELPGTQVLSIEFDGKTAVLEIGAHEDGPATHSMISGDLGDTWTVGGPGLRRLMEADLDRDGTAETLEVIRSGEGYTLRAVQDGEVLWSDTMDESHGGCDTYFLYQADGLDYLLEYMPNMQQGDCTYSYRLFHLENGREVLDRKNRVEFDINFASQSHRFDPAEIAAFMEEANRLIGQSQLLLNTNHWLLNLKEDGDGRLYDDILAALHHPGEDLGDRPLLEALEIYARQSEDHPDDTNSPLGDLLAGLEPADIGDISGQSEVTASQLAKLLREAVRGSRYYAYETFAQAEAWQISTAKWAVPLSDGRTLYLLSCDSGNVDMVYETDEGATSAFFLQPEALHALIEKVGEPYPIEILPYKVNLDRDRSPDQLVLRSDRPDGAAWSLQCRLGSGETWSAEAYTAHVGWTSYYLCRLDGEDYLLEYQPWSGGGGCAYHYKLFYLDREGREIAAQENEVAFDLNFDLEGTEGHSFDPAAIADFMDEVNALLEHSTLLLNTDPTLAETFKKEGRLYDSVSFLDAYRDEERSLLENLLVCRNQGLIDASVPNMREVMANIQPEDLGGTAGESRQAIVDGLHRASENITWRDGEPEVVRALSVDYAVKPNLSPTHRICLEATATENLLHIRCEGSNPVLIYSENPADMDARYLRDVPYSVEFYVEDAELYQMVRTQGKVVEEDRF